MESLKKIGMGILLFIAIIGAGCSLGWLGYHKEWVAFVGELVVIGLAVPTWIALFKKLLE